MKLAWNDRLDLLHHIKLKLRLRIGPLRFYKDSCAFPRLHTSRAVVDSRSSPGYNIKYMDQAVNNIVTKKADEWSGYSQMIS